MGFETGHILLTSFCHTNRSDILIPECGRLSDIAVVDEDEEVKWEMMVGDGGRQRWR